MEQLLTIVLALIIATSTFVGLPANVAETPTTYESAETNVEATEPDAAETDSVESPVNVSDGFVFVHDDVLVKPTEPADQARALLDAANETGEAPSCAFEGLDKVYYFDGFEIQSGLVNNVELITGVILLDDSVQTAEGLKIGMSLDEMLAIYGDEYTEDFGQYVYEDDAVQLIMIVFNDEVISISYIGKFDHVI